MLAIRLVYSTIKHQRTTVSRFGTVFINPVTYVYACIYKVAVFACMYKVAVFSWIYNLCVVTYVLHSYVCICLYVCCVV